MAAIFWTFGISLSFSFIALDDAKHIWSNPLVTNLSFENLKVFWEKPYYGLYIPLTYNLWSLTLWLTDAFALKDPITQWSAHLFHLLNVFFHALNSILIYYLLRSLQKSTFKHLDATGYIPVAAALIFALHPLQVEAVAWASGLKDLLSGFFALSSALIFFERPRWVALSYFAFFLAMIAKPGVAALPAVLFLIRLKADDFDWRKDGLRLFPFFAVLLPLVYLTSAQQPLERLDVVLNWDEKAATALGVLGFYISKVIFPYPLSPDYGLTPLRLIGHSLYPFYVFLSFALFACGVYSLKVRSNFSIGILVFLAGVMPHLGWIQFEFQNISAVADRYMYLLPMFGVALIGLEIFYRLSCLLSGYRKVIGLFAVPFLLLSPLSLQASLNWKDNQSLFSHVARHNPGSVIAHNNLGLVALRSGEYDQALSHFQNIIKFKPKFLAAYSNLGAVYIKQKNYAAVKRLYDDFFNRHPPPVRGSTTYADIYYNWAAAHINSGEKSESLPLLDKALSYNPKLFPALYQKGKVLIQLNQNDAAYKSFLAAYRLNPQHPGLLKELKRWKSPSH